MVSIRPIDPQSISLTPSQLRLLCRIRTSAGKYGLGLLGCEISDALVLIDRGFIQESPTPLHSRGHYVEITAAGRDQLRALYG